ncbi:MAG: cell division protein ZipA C-terminal FtsZ-binding domain-containing protein [Candidatus Contendobacter sp.]|jgi:cell division protein ZipA|nr:cell division protein ZipA C-terminal FtsZ-binding domain-containing protein [Candidatus Contendobacter sp.]
MLEMDKTQLQWLLAGIGAVVVALIYLWSSRARIREGIRKRRRRPTLDNSPALGGSEMPMPDPVLNVQDFRDFGRITSDHHLADKVLVDVEIHPVQHRADDDAGIAETVADAPESPRPTRREPALSEPPKMTVALTVMAAQGQSFAGPEIAAAVESSGFRLGAAGLFERLPDGEVHAADPPVFSMAHLREPGVFSSATLETLATPGLLLFMKLPGPLEEIKALDLLVLTADQLARELDGTISDERRRPMTNQGLLHLRNQVADLERRRRAWAQSF